MYKLIKQTKNPAQQLPSVCSIQPRRHPLVATYDLIIIYLDDSELLRDYGGVKEANAQLYH